MPIFDDPNMIREVIMDHYEYPRNHGLKDDSSYTKVNIDAESCIDNIDLQVKIENGVIKDIRFDGVACTISTASTSIMSEMLKGKTIQEAKEIIHNYLHMLHGEEYDPDILEEANVFVNTSKQANRVKCATRSWDALEELLDK